jgi:hypothetical protein
MKQTVVIYFPTCFGYCLSIIRELHCALLKLQMSLYVENVQIVQRQGLAVIFHVVRFSLQEPVMCGLVAGLRVYFQTCFLSFNFASKMLHKCFN